MELMVCRLCLSTDTKLYDMCRYRLKSIYFDLCGNNVASRLDLYPHRICVYCAATLNKFAMFKDRCEQARQLMEFLLADNQLTTDHIRKVNSLNSTFFQLSMQTVHNIDSTTEIKDEERHSELDIIDEYGTNDFIEFSDFKNDSDDEPLAKKAKKRRKKTKGNDINVIYQNRLASDENAELTSTSLFELKQSVKNDSDIWENVNELSEVKLSENIQWESEDFDLVLLTDEQQIEEVIARKLSSNYLNSVYKCEYCYKGFMTEMTFKNHMVRHDPSSGPVSCAVCQSRWADARAARAHSLVAHARRYVCRACSHQAKSHHKAKEHAKWHKGYVFVCKLCGSSFAKSTSHLTHMRVAHAGGACGRDCDACGEHFLSQNGLNMHKRKAHRTLESNIEYLECDICGAKFRNEVALKRHRDLSNDDICDTKLRSCSYCGEGFSDEDMFKEHTESHQREDAVRTCTECSRTFANERRLAAHRARAHGSARRSRAPAKDAVCEICGYTCISRASLVYHQRIHTGEKPFQCTLCEKSFSVYQRLQIHVRTHTGERPFPCAVCPKAFKHKAALNRHHRVHTGARPYRCATCGKAFSQSNSMKQHAASVHLKAPLYARSSKIKQSDAAKCTNFGLQVT